MRRAVSALLLAALLLLVSVAAAQAQTITVTTTDDAGTGTGDCLTSDQSCSLRQAVNAENGTTSGGDTIALEASTYTLTQGTDLIITASVTLQGAGVAATSIDGSQNSGTNQFGALARILRVDPGATVTIDNLTFTGGVDEEDENCSSGCNTIDANGGGALFNNGGTVSITDVAFTGNASSGTPLGGAVSNGAGTLTLSDVAFTGNAAGAGGAVFTRSGTVTATGITFENNFTTCCEGGAAYLLGGTVSLTNATIVSSGGFNATGAIDNAGSHLTLDNDTLSDNGADLQTDSGASTTAENAILATGQSGGVACIPPGRRDSLSLGTTGNAVTRDTGNNLDQDGSCNLIVGGDESDIDPLLGPIGDNGGPTRTEALLAGSPAIGAANEANCPATDQRGITRKNPCDIGAYETPAPAPPPNPPPPNPPPPNPPPTNPGTPASPTAVTGTPSTAATAAALSGSVVPNGLATTVFFQYGLDSRYRKPGTSGPVYDHSTPPETVGSDFSSHVIGPVAVADLVPNAEYHVRLVATNSAGTTYGTDVAFTTATTPLPGPPALGRRFNIATVSGLVLIHTRGQVVPLTEAEQVGPGVVIDARAGSIKLVTATSRRNQSQRGIFGGAIFRLTQDRRGRSRGLVTLALVNNAFDGAPSYAMCKTRKKATDASAAALPTRTLQLLHASAHGKFRTSGRYSAATVRGTIWSIADRCDGTLTRDITDSVIVTDFVRHKTIVLHRGQSYLAHAPRKPRAPREHEQK